MNINIRVPEIGSESLEIIEILVKENDFVKVNQALVVVEGQKTSMEIPALESGLVKSILVKVGDKIKTGMLLLILSKKKSKSLNFNKKINKKNHINIHKKNINKSFFLNDKNNFLKEYLYQYSSPAVKRISRKYSLDLTKIVGTGRNFRITVEDVLKKLKKNKKKKHIKKKEIEQKNNNIKTLKKKSFIYLSNIQKISNKKFLKSLKKIPHVTHFHESDITKLEKFRKKYNFSLKKKEYKLSLLTFIIKAVSKSLIKYPRFNSTFLENENKIIFNKKVNVGIAVNTNDGILVPVLKNLKKKKFFDISYMLNKVIQDTRQKNLQISQITNSNFTISSLGSFNSGSFTPIINFPEVAILGISTAKIKPYWKNKKFIPKLFVPFSLSYDHRVINGVDAVLFLNYLSNCLKNFYKILF